MNQDSSARIKEIGDEIAGLRQRIAALEDERVRLMTSEIEAQSPFKVGQLIRRTRSKPYGYHGKSKTERYRIVAFAKLGTVAVRLRKDGTEGATVRLTNREIGECAPEAPLGD